MDLYRLASWLTNIYRTKLQVGKLVDKYISYKYISYKTTSKNQPVSQKKKNNLLVIIIADLKPKLQGINSFLYYLKAYLD